MEWLRYLTLLICPLMMLFCMKGLFSHGKGHNHSSHGANHLDSKMAKLELDNEKLRREINMLSDMVKKES